MKLCLVAVCLGVLCISVASGQWLEATVPVHLPAQALCWNPVGNKVYCAVGYPDAYGAVAVIDGAGNVLLDTVMLNCQVPGGICLDAVHDRVYVAGSSYYPLEESLVTAIDGASDTVVARIALGSGPRALCCNPDANKLYCASQLADQIAIIDCSTYGPPTVHSVPSWPVDMVYAPEVNRVYCAEQGPRNSPNFMVTVIDGTTDSILRTIFVGHYARSICYNRTDAKVYTANGFDGNVSVVDINTNTVVATVTVGGSPLAVFWNPFSNRVYCSDEGSGTLWVIDGAANQLVSTVSMVGPVGAMCLDSTAGKVYCSNFLDSAVTVVDARADTIIKTIATGAEPGSMCHNPLNRRVYVGNQGDSTVSVIRDTTSSSVEERPTGHRRPTFDIRPNPSTGVLHVSIGPGAGRPETIRVYNAAGRIAAELRPGANDIRNLSSGTYFVGRPGSGRTTKLVVR